MKKMEEFNAADRIDLRLLENSTYYLNGEIEEESVAKVIKWLLYENLNGEGRMLTLYINSTGGDLYQALALIDVMRSSPHVIRTIGIGAVMSAAFLIFACGDKTHRYVAHNASFMCHQFSSAADAKYHDLKAEMKENESLNTKMTDILIETTGMPRSRVKAKLLPASDVYLTASEMVDLGVADQVI